MQYLTLEQLAALTLEQLAGLELDSPLTAGGGARGRPHRGRDWR